MPSSLNAFLPELVLLLGALALFGVTLGDNATRLARNVSLGLAAALIGACLLALGAQEVLFSGAYRVDAFSQWLKLVFAIGYLLVLLLSRDIGDIRPDIRPEYFLFLSLGICGLLFLVSSVELITLFVSLELSSYPLYLMVAMRREREGQKAQMESAIKYMMFGIAANGIMLFGLSYLYGLTGSTSLPVMAAKLGAFAGSPLAVAGVSLALAGLFYKLAVFPFHFWTPDVYQGSSNETAALVASLPKIGAVAVLVRFVSLGAPSGGTTATLLACLAAASMLYGNLIALVQKDLKRLLGFSGIAHAGYALVGFVTLDSAGYAAALFYISGYMLMVLAAFLVVSRVARDGDNLSIEELAGLHKRSPLLAFTLGVSVFALAGIPPFVGFMAKFNLLGAALGAGWLWLVVFTVVNSAIAVYYYLRIIKEAYFSDAGNLPAVPVDGGTRVLCSALILGIVALGIAPSFVIDSITLSLTTLQYAAR